jgi:predicted RNA-binding Zn ribbon-like protein
MTRALSKMAHGKPQAARETLDFLFLAGNPALDFVNTRPVLRGQPTELLNDFAAALRWFVAAKLLDQKAAAKFRERWANTPQAHAFLRQLLVFREQLRCAILSIESGAAVSKKMLDTLNSLLAQHPLPAQVVFFEGTLRKEHRFDPQKPVDLFAPLLSSAADLFTRFDSRRLRQCERCVLHFYDATKNATRRWCSMKLCGNRAKAAKYAARHRLQSP